MKRDIADLRVEYETAGLHERDIHGDPLVQFDRWFQEALAAGIDVPNAMVLATADGQGRPSARYVLLKEYDEGGFVFYTSSHSRKGRELAENPRAALVFYWSALHRQVHIEGGVTQLEPDKADGYFQSRPRGSQISAWVGTQSSIIESREKMEDKARALSREFASRPVPRPDNWLGYRVRPESIEFWQGRENRLHDRIRYQRNTTGSWITSRLVP